MRETTTTYRPVVVVVDDDPVIRMLCSRSLERVGFQVLAVSDSRDAMALARDHADRVVLLLVDVVLDAPKMRFVDEPENDEDGTDVLRRLLSLFPAAVPVQMSAYKPDELKSNGYAVATTHFLQKPFTPSLLRSAVEGLLLDLQLPADTLTALRQLFVSKAPSS